MTLRNKYKLAKANIKLRDLKSANYYLDLCLVHLSKATLNGVDHLEGASVDLWKTRVWTTIEKAGLLPK